MALLNLKVLSDTKDFQELLSSAFAVT